MEPQKKSIGNETNDKTDLYSMIPELKSKNEELEQDLRNICKDDFENFKAKVNELFKSTKFFGESSNPSLRLRHFVLVIASECLNVSLKTLTVIKNIDESFEKNTDTYSSKKPAAGKPAGGKPALPAAGWDEPIPTDSDSDSDSDSKAAKSNDDLSSKIFLFVKGSNFYKLFFDNSCRMYEKRKRCDWIVGP